MSTGKPLNPIAESWVPSETTKMVQLQPLLPHQLFHSPPPSLTYIPLYYYPTSLAAGELFYNHVPLNDHHYGYNFNVSYPQYYNYPLPEHDGGAMIVMKPQMVALEKEMGGRKTEAPKERAEGSFGMKKKKVFAPALPPRLLRTGMRREDGNLGRNRIKNNPSGLKWKPKTNDSGEKKSGGGGGGVGIEANGADSSSLPKIIGDGNDEPFCGKKTTVMIRNIPNKLRRHSLMNFLDGYCEDHSLEYDFIYLPIDFKRLDNMGYAFVNFTTPSAALMIMELLNDYKWGGVDPSGRNKGYLQSKKICKVTWAKIQGKKELIRHFEQSTFACHTVDFLPAAFDPPHPRNGQTDNTILKTIGKLKPIGPGYPNHLVGRRAR